MSLQLAMVMAFSGGSPREAPPGEAVFTTPGTYYWTCPPGVFSVSAVAIGSGWQTGGGLGWKNSIPVIPGQVYAVVVGDAVDGTRGDSYFVSVTTVAGYGARATANNYPGGFVGDGGGNGGLLAGGNATAKMSEGYGGAGAGGYTGKGGNGGYYNIPDQQNVLAQVGQGGGGGGGGACGRAYRSASDSWSATHPCGGGGGTGLYGIGPSGNAGNNASSDFGLPGYGGSGGSNGSIGKSSSFGDTVDEGGSGGKYGGGAGSSSYNTRYTTSRGTLGPHSTGAVRIMWGGGRSFPNNAAKI